MEENGKMIVANISDIEPAKLKIEQAKDMILSLFEIDTELKRTDIITLVKKETGIGEKNIAEGIRELVKDKLLVDFQQGKEKHYKLTIKE
jgi:tRNA-binding EMAP/Myf-like protein